MSTNTNTNSTTPDQCEHCDGGQPEAECVCASTFGATNVSTAPEWFVGPEWSDGFAFEPDRAIGDAVAALLRTEVRAWRDLVKACQALAAADEASPLSRGQRAKLGAAVMVDYIGRPGDVACMTTSTYSKRVKVGRATVDQVAQFELDCTDPTLDKLYNWLPKTPHLSKAKDTGRRAKAKAAKAAVSAGETVDAPAVFADTDAPRIAAEFLAGLRTRGATTLQTSMVIDELIRLTTPVRSVPAAA